MLFSKSKGHNLGCTQLFSARKSTCVGLTLCMNVFMVCRIRTSGIGYLCIVGYIVYLRVWIRVGNSRHNELVSWVHRACFQMPKGSILPFGIWYFVIPQPWAVWVLQYTRRNEWPLSERVPTRTQILECQSTVKQLKGVSIMPTSDTTYYSRMLGSERDLSSIA